MGKWWLGAAAGLAVGLVTAPAGAAGPGPSGSFPSPNFSASGGFHFGDHPGFGDRRRGDNLGVWINAGEWARYNNEAFKSDSYNDWWHDRPDRAYPAWVRNNQPCRPYWSGGGWRC